MSTHIAQAIDIEKLHLYEEDVFLTCTYINIRAAALINFQTPTNVVGQFFTTRYVAVSYLIMSCRFVATNMTSLLIRCDHYH